MADGSDMSEEQGSGGASPVTIEINVKGLEDVATAAEAAALAVNRLADAFERLRQHLGEASEGPQ